MYPKNLYLYLEDGEVIEAVCKNAVSEKALRAGGYGDEEAEFDIIGDPKVLEFTAPGPEGLGQEAEPEVIEEAEAEVLEAPVSTDVADIKQEAEAEVVEEVKKAPAKNKNKK